MSLHFIADVHLGRLARALRMLGFNTIYRNDLTKMELLQIASVEDRILLSKNPAFEKELAISSFTRIESDNWMDQLQQVISTYNLKNQIAPFTRCMVCNGILLKAGKQDIEDELEANTRKYYDDFWQCENCRRLYWKGPHFNHMSETIKNLIATTDAPG